MRPDLGAADLEAVVSLDTLESILDAIADRLAERLERRDQTRINQRDPRGLGPRRHREVVKRRIREHQGGAYIRGRDYELTPEALREELEQFGPRGVDSGKLVPAAMRRCKATSTESAEVAALRRKLDAELGAPTRVPRRTGH